MNKADLVNKLAIKMHITQTQSREFLNTFQDVLTEAIKQDNPVMLPGYKKNVKDETRKQVFPVWYRHVQVSSSNLESFC